jgi:hypothetical protein
MAQRVEPIKFSGIVVGQQYTFDPELPPLGSPETFNYATSITEHSELCLRVAVRSISTTEDDYDVDGNPSDEAVRRIAMQAAGVVEALDVEEADKTGRRAAADVMLETDHLILNKHRVVYRIAEEQMRAKRDAWMREQSQELLWAIDLPPNEVLTRFLTDLLAVKEVRDKFRAANDEEVVDEDRAAGGIVDREVAVDRIFRGRAEIFTRFLTDILAIKRGTVEETFDSPYDKEIITLFMQLKLNDTQQRLLSAAYTDKAEELVNHLREWLTAASEGDTTEKEKEE